MIYWGKVDVEMWILIGRLVYIHYMYDYGGVNSLKKPWFIV